MTLSGLVLSAILTVSPKLDPNIAQRYADDIAMAAGDDVELAAALVATGDEEGKHFSPRIEKCICRLDECDHDARSGRFLAAGMFQLHRFWYRSHTRAEICASNRLGAELAAKALVSLRARFGGIRSAMKWYVGNVPKTDPRVARRLRVFERTVANMRRALGDART